MEQKVIITDKQSEINSWIEKGWKVVSVTAGHVSTGTSFTAHGMFCFILERYR
jgi:hypothetical protein